MSSRPVVFGDAALTYDRIRPGYPAETIEHVLHLVETRRALEVGAGTGKATVGVARPGLELICLEPSAAMADVLEAKQLPGVTVMRTTFEAWPAGQPVFDLVFAAQSWHWVDRVTGYEKAKQVLRAGGGLALMWNLPTHRHQGFEEAYQRWAPQILDEKDERVRRRDAHDWLVDMGEAGFEQLGKAEWKWSAQLTATEYRDLCSTYSDHMILPAETRRGLLSEIEELATERGDLVVQDYVTTVFSGRLSVGGEG